MMSFSGFTGYQVIQSLKRAYPHMAQGLTQAQVAGYTARQITSMMRKGKGEKVTDEDFYETPTEHEQTKEFDRRNKRKAIKQALSAMGATGAAIGLTLSGYQYLKANSNNPNMTILPALGKGGKKTAPQLPNKTVNVPNKRLPNQQGQLPFIPQGMQGPQQQAQLPSPQGPQAPQGAPPQQPQLPGRPPTLSLPGPPDYLKSVGIVNNLRESTRFENILKQGFDVGMSSDIIRSIMKEQSASPLSILEKAPGGLDKVVSDYSQYMQDKKQQEQYSAALPKQQDERVEFKQPPGIIRMKGPQGQQQATPQPPPQVQEPAPMQQPQQAGPGRQRLMGLMEKLKAARGESAITPIQTPPPQAAPQLPVAPKAAPLQQVPSYPILPPAPTNLPAPKKAETKEKPKRATKAEKEEKKRKEVQEKKKELKDRLDNAKKREKKLIEEIKKEPKNKLAKSMLTENKKVIDSTKDYIKHLEEEIPFLPAKQHINYDELKEVGAKIDSKGFVTVYHRTSKENAKHILSSGKLKTKEDAAFFSTEKNGQAAGYGDEVIELNIPINKLELDDIFEDEAHVKIPLGSKRELDISKYIKHKPVINKVSDIQPKIDKIEKQDISKKGLGDQKSYLVDHIQKAIDNPPEGKTVKIHIPGDGEFNLINDKKVLEAALKKVEKNWPKEAVKTKEHPKHRQIARNPSILEELRVK